MEIFLKNISKSFNGKEVLHPTNIHIKNGEFTTLLGPSGCGKSTLLRIIAGLEQPDSGEIWFNDHCVFSKGKKINTAPEKRNIGFVFQDFALWPHMTVFENVAFGLQARKDTENLKERVHDALKLVKLDELEKRYPHQLSGGQQQRVAFARAIAVHPACILLDEPLSALDALLREQMRHELKQLVDQLKTTAVFVTHDQSEAMSLSDRIAVMSDGHIEQYDFPEKIYHHPQTPFVARFIGKTNWINNTELFRPEAITTEPIQGFVHYDLPVLSTQYLGDCYEVIVNHNNQNWIIHCNERISPAKNLSFYIDPKMIINCESKEYLNEN